MWLERFGDVEAQIFYGFCAIVGIILVVTIVNFFIACFARGSPGHSLNFPLNFSVIFVGLSVLIRGVQTSWASIETFNILSQFFVVLMVIGSTLFVSVLTIQSWVFSAEFSLINKSCSKGVNFLVLSLLVAVAVVASIVWELVFRPSCVENLNRTTENIYNQTVFDCVDPEDYWSDTTGGSSFYQFWWRVGTSIHFAAILSANIVGLPVLLSVRLPVHLKWLKTRHVVLILVNVNFILCVIAGLACWFALRPTLPSPSQGSYMYAIIGGLQLWILFFTQVTFLISELQAMETCKRTTNRYPQDSRGRLLTNSGLSTLDRDSLNVDNLDMYSPANNANIRTTYVNSQFAEAENDTNTRRFRY